MTVPDARPLRSMLWVPGNREKWMAQAPGYGADALILDLEDSVPPREKSEARHLVRKALDRAGGSDPVAFVRVNGLDSGLIEDDLEAVVSPALYGILLPKVEGPEDITNADTLLGRFERRAGVGIGTLFIQPGIETARGIREAYEIGKASQRVAYMGMAHMKSGDAARDIGFIWSHEGKETLFLRAKVLLDARAAGTPYPCAGPWSDITDLDGLRAYCREMRQLGYTGFTALHPSHVPVANEVFTPTREEIAYWQGVVQAMEEAEKVGRAAVIYEGQMVDIAMEKTARSGLEMAQRIGVLRD